MLSPRIRLVMGRLTRGVARRVRRAGWRLGLTSDGNVVLARRIERLLDTTARDLVERASIPGLAVGVQLAAGPPIFRCFGHADAETKRAMDPDTLFQAMSISKTLSATLMARLVEAGAMEFDAAISRRLRSWTMPTERRGGFDFDEVTLRRLLSHTAGLNIHAFGWAPAHAGHLFGQAQPDPRALLDGLAGEPARLVTRPGVEMNYSGAGYALAEVLAEDATGLAFSELARRYVFEPLGMSRSHARPTPDPDDRLAVRYLHPAPGSTAVVPQPALVVASAAGTGVYTTPRDLLRFMTCFLHDERSASATGALSPALIEQMLRPHLPIRGARNVGLGFQLWLRNSDVSFAHRGYRDGWWSEVIGLRRRRCAIVVMCNGDVHEQAAKPIAGMLRQCVLDYAP